MFLRFKYEQKGQRMPQLSRAGIGLVSNFAIDNRAAETDETLTIGQISGGLIHQGTTLTSDVTYTLPIAAVIAAAYTGMDIGDAYSFVVNNSQVGAFDVIIAVGNNITKVGADNTLSVPPQSSRIFTLVKTGAATFDLY